MHRQHVISIWNGANRSPCSKVVWLATWAILHTSNQCSIYQLSIINYESIL